MKVMLISCGFIAFDIITGLVKACKQGAVNSTYLRHGLFSKAGEILTLVGAYLLEYAVGYVGLSGYVPMLGAVAIYICLMETVSCMENLCEINSDLASLFKPYLEKISKKGEGE